LKLKEAVDLTFKTRDTWANGSGSKTARINSNHILRILGNDQEIEEIRSQHFSKLSQQLLEEGKANGTINRITAALSTILNEMRCQGIEIPMVKYKRRKEKRGRPGYYTEEEMETILEAAKRLNDGLLLHDSILFALKTGCRQGEMLQLTEDNINIEEREIIFLDTKDGTDHYIKMHEELVPALERRLERQAWGVLFPWSSKDNLLDSFQALRKSCGMDIEDGRVWHTLRHTTATWLCDRGVALRTVMGVLNHKRVETTLRYSKASYRSVAAAIDAL
jgi:integrase